MSSFTGLEPKDRILLELTNHGGSMPHRAMIRRMRMDQAELDLFLEELEQECKIKRTDLRIGKSRPMKQLIVLRDL
jgi:nitrogenase molybdenum-iron protein alpha/beta subunit